MPGSVFGGEGQRCMHRLEISCVFLRASLTAMWCVENTPKYNRSVAPTTPFSLKQSGEMMGSREF